MVVAGIAVPEVPGPEVQDAQEAGDEHPGLVVLASLAVQGPEDVHGVVGIGGGKVEQGVGHGHDDRRGDAFPAHVADQEEQFPVPDEEVEQVSAHHPGRLERPVQVDVAAVRIRREGLGQHRLLDFPGDGELVADPGPVHIGVPQFPFVAGDALDHEEQGDEGGQGQEEVEQAEFAEPAVEFLLEDDLGHPPARLLLPGRVEDEGLVM